MGLLAPLWGSAAAPTASTRAPAFFRGEFSVGQGKVADTFLTLLGWGKGQAWINGDNLARYWSIGPQYSFLVPAGFLHEGQNEVILLEPGGATRARRPQVVEPPGRREEIVVRVRGVDPGLDGVAGPLHPVGQVLRQRLRKPPPVGALVVWLLRPAAPLVRRPPARRGPAAGRRAPAGAAAPSCRAPSKRCGTARSCRGGGAARHV